MDKKDLIERLKLIDEEASLVLPLNHRVKVTIVGGSSLILHGCLVRVTLDIDIIESFYPVLNPIFEKYDMNCRSNAFCDCLAENYANRLKKLNIKTKAIDYYLMSLEDIVIMKLFSDRKKDLDDIRSKTVVESLNWQLLDSIISSGEADVSFNERRYKLFLEKYKSYVEEYKK